MTRDAGIGAATRGRARIRRCGEPATATAATTRATGAATDAAAGTLGQSRTRGGDTTVVTGGEATARTNAARTAVVSAVVGERPHTTTGDTGVVFATGENVLALFLMVTFEEDPSSWGQQASVALATNLLQTQERQRSNVGSHHEGRRLGCRLIDQSSGVFDSLRSVWAWELYGCPWVTMAVHRDYHGCPRYSPRLAVRSHGDDHGQLRWPRWVAMAVHAVHGDHHGCPR